MIELYNRAKKAIHGAAIAILPWAYLVVESAPTRITGAEWLGLAGAVFGVGGTVYASRNLAPVRRDDDGAIGLGEAIVLVVVLLIFCRVFGLI